MAADTLADDVATLIHAARADHDGTDYPGTLEMGRDLASRFDNRREARMVAALLVVALEGDTQTSNGAQYDLRQYIEAL